MAEEGLFTDDDVFKIKTTDIKRLLQYHMEDILHLLDGSTIIVYFKQCTNSVIDNKYDGKPGIAAKIQRHEGNAGVTTVIGGITLLALKMIEYKAPLHHEAVTDGLLKAQFQKMYKSNEGFLAQYCGIDIRQSFSWRDLVQFAEDVLVFSQPLNNSRRYNMLFLDKSSVQLWQFVYRGMAREMFGDVFASSALALAYTQKMLALVECDLKVERHRELLLEFNETDQSHRFFE